MSVLAQYATGKQGLTPTTSWAGGPRAPLVVAAGMQPAPFPGSCGFESRLGEYLIDALAAYRLTRLLVEDHMPFGPVRDWVTGRWPRSLAAEWVQCPWCAGLWVAAGVVAARRLVPRVWSPAAMVLALGAAAGLLSSWETRN